MLKYSTSEKHAGLNFQRWSKRSHQQRVKDNRKKNHHPKLQICINRLEELAVKSLPDWKIIFTQHLSQQEDNDRPYIFFFRQNGFDCGCVRVGIGFCLDVSYPVACLWGFHVLQDQSISWRLHGDRWEWLTYLPACPWPSCPGLSDTAACLDKKPRNAQGVRRRLQGSCCHSPVK